MPPKKHVNVCPADLVKWGIEIEKDTQLTDRGALSVRSGKNMGRVPSAKRIVDCPEIHKYIDWGKVNMPISEASFEKCKSRALSHLETKAHLFVVDCFAGHDPEHRLKVRVITTRPYHALFMTNMLIIPTAEELKHFGVPEYTIYNAGEILADTSVDGVDKKSQACVALNFKTMEQVILGTQYAGEMKKGVLTLMMYLMARKGHLCMHASANESFTTKSVSVFFGLSGTGKTTLSADPHRALIGDDEHVWTPNGVFNIEGGCYAKAKDLSRETEREIWDAVKFGAVAENCILKPDSNEIDFRDCKLTQNTRVAYPLVFIPNTKLPAVGGHPKHVIFLTNDAFGVMPPVSLLTRGQAMFWFISGYTAQVPGTVMGVNEPIPTFSACFGAAFLVMHPTYYGMQLADKLAQYGAKCWLLNTGWSGGRWKRDGTGGKRMKLRITRALVDAIHAGTLEREEYEVMPGWGLRVPKQCKHVPSEVLNPINNWKDKNEFITTINALAVRFQDNFKKYQDKATPEMLGAIPQKYQLSKM